MDKPEKLEVGIVKEGWKKRLFKPTKKQVLLSAAMLLVVAVVSLLLVQSQKPRKLSVEESDAQYAQARLNETKKYPPAADAPIEEKITYYSEVIGGEYGSGNYQQAIEEYKKLHSLAGDKPLPYGTYKLAAQSYVAIGDRKAAATVLDEAEQAVKKSGLDREDKALYDELLQKINNLRKDILG